ncbi:MAG: O-antigen translocase [Bacteroidales bacterium]|nr:O-antigen translocase [Bacteroidales bacterium]
MPTPQDSYRQIMKSTSIFGGVQVVNILIAIVRSKFIAVLLGPAGMGIAGLLTSTTGFIGALTGFGIGTSAVRNVSEANAGGNPDRISLIITVLRRLVWITGLLGMLLTIVLSPWLSRLTFGNSEYTWAFIWISVSLLINQLSSGQMVLLQGMRKLRYLAQANLTGSIAGLIITVPLYYYFGLKGIVPGIILTAFLTLAGSWYFARKVNIGSIPVTTAETYAEGKNMLTMGFMISLSGMIALGVSYLVRIFISNTGSLEQVGLYNAGFAIVNGYVGLVFTALSTDYYPRLAAVASDNIESKKLINQQAEIAFLILAPILIVFLVFINWIVILLYSSEFIPVTDMVLWAAMGMFFKAGSWAIAYLFLAKGASRLFFWNELLANFYVLLFNVAGYYYYGLTGLGVSFMLVYIVYLVQVYLISSRKYKFSFSGDTITIFIFQFLLVVLAFVVSVLIQGNLKYLPLTLLFLASLLYSVRELDKRLGLISLLKNSRRYKE